MTKNPYRIPENSSPGSDFNLDSQNNTCNYKNKLVEIPETLAKKLCMLGIIDYSGIRDNNIGESNYSEHLIQPWSIWIDYPELTSWDHDIIKRILRTKVMIGYSYEESRISDYRKIIHICEERIRQIELKQQINENN